MFVVLFSGLCPNACSGRAERRRSESRRASGVIALTTVALIVLWCFASAFFSLRVFGFLHLLIRIEPVNLAAAGANDFGCCRLPLRGFDLAGNGPEETNQLASDGCDSDHALLAHGQLLEAFVQPLLRL